MEIKTPDKTGHLLQDRAVLPENAGRPDGTSS